MIPRLGDGNCESVFVKGELPLCLENDSPSRGRKRIFEEGIVAVSV